MTETLTITITVPLVRSSFGLLALATSHEALLEELKEACESKDLEMTCTTSTAAPEPEAPKRKHRKTRTEPNPLAGKSPQELNAILANAMLAGDA